MEDKKQIGIIQQKVVMVARNAEKLLDTKEIYKTEGADFWKKYEAGYKQVDKEIDEVEQMAKQANTIVGRLIKFPVVDGYALYLVHKITKKLAYLMWVRYIDDYIDDRIGDYGTVTLDYAMQHIQGQDALDKLFNKKP